MRYAIVSDIHGNQQAWKAVLEDIASVGVDETICLGDIVGYGPCPAEVLESVWEGASEDESNRLVTACQEDER